MSFTDDEFEEALVHFGRKGMKWGEHVYDTERSSSEQKQHSSKVKSVTIAAGFGAATLVATRNPILAAGVAGGTYFIAKHATYPASSLSSEHQAAGKEFTDGVVKRQSKG